MKKGDIVNYFGRTAKVVLFDRTHAVIEFEDGSKLCTTRSRLIEINN